jgi:hypothetical protein
MSMSDFGPRSFAFPDCNYWGSSYQSNAGHFGSPCDSLIALYDKEISCGPCDSAILHLKLAITVCGGADKDTAGLADLNDRLAELLGATAKCGNGTWQSFADLATWYQAGASAAQSDSIALLYEWYFGRALGLGGYFLDAKSIFDSIAQHVQDPSMQASAIAQSQVLHMLDSVLGSRSGEFGKRLVYRGRAGMLPVDNSNPIGLICFPNPFNPTAQIAFSVPEAGQTRVLIYDSHARQVIALVDEVRAAGRYTVRFDASALPAGIYFVRVTVPG